VKKNAAEFEALFRKTLAAAQVAFGGTPDVDPDRMVELHLNGMQLVSINEAASRLFLDEDRFFKVIDVSVRPDGERGSAFFVRPSGHSPSSWENTWFPESTGPFKVMMPA